MQNEVKVSQEDLGWATSAAQHLCSTQDRDAAIRLLAQAFARHRHQAERGEAWRPIETAPKDWTDVLVFSPEHEGFNCGGVFSAFYDTDDACWFTHGPGHNIRLHPTHWQPLPTPPEAS